MQSEVSNKIQLGENLNPLRDMSNVPSIDNVGNLKDVFGKVDTLGVLWNKGETDASLVRYIPSLSDASRQGQIYSINHKEAYAAQTYTDKKSLEFTVNLAANTYTNYSSMCVVIPIQRKKKIDNTAEINETLMTVNKFFCHWLKEIDIKRYLDEVHILPTNNTVEI